MADNKVIRRFFRRETDELTIHDRIFRPHLRIVAFHIFAAVLDHPDIEVVELTNFDYGYSEPTTISLLWESCAVGFEETRQYITTGYALVVHSGFENLRFVVVVDSEDKTFLRLYLRSEDIEYLEPLLEWLEASNPHC